MKKILSLILLAAALLCFASCASEPEIPTDVDFAACLVTEMSGGMLTVTGTTELGKSQSVLVIPAAIDGVPLKSIAEGAFEGCQKLKTVYINADCSISYLNNGAFKGAISLSRIVIGKKHSEITVGNGLMDGAPSGAKISVPAEYFGDYTTDYQWGAFSARIVKQS